MQTMSIVGVLAFTSFSLCVPRRVACACVCLCVCVYTCPFLRLVCSLTLWKRYKGGNKEESERERGGRWRVEGATDARAELLKYELRSLVALRIACRRLLSPAQSHVSLPFLPCRCRSTSPSLFFAFTLKVERCCRCCWRALLLHVRMRVCMCWRCTTDVSLSLPLRCCFFFVSPHSRIYVCVCEWGCGVR